MKYRIIEKIFKDNSKVYVVQRKSCLLCPWDDLCYSEEMDIPIPVYYQSYNEARDKINEIMKEIDSGTVKKINKLWQSS